MTETFSQNFKKIFLLTFTKELIIRSAKKDIMKLQSIIESKEKKRKNKYLDEPTMTFTKELIVPSAKREEEYLGEPIPAFTREAKEMKIPVQEISKKPIEVQLIRKPIVIEINQRAPARQVKKPIVRYPLFIPEPKLPPHLEYLQPIPTAGVEIDLFKLNPLIKDGAVRIIEVNPDEKVIVSGTMGTKLTDIVLNKEDIDRVINKFSEVSKIPINEGIYKIVVGNLILSAIISETIGAKFIIKKMMINANPSENLQQKYPIIPPISGFANFR